MGSPSVHYTGRVYTWYGVSDGHSSDLGDLPQCFIDFAAHGEKVFGPRAAERPAPRTTSRQKSLSECLQAMHSPPTWSEAHEREIMAALQCIPADDYDVWLKIGMALKWTGWGERAWQIWEQWSQKSSKFDLADQKKNGRALDGPTGRVL